MTKDDSMEVKGVGMRIESKELLISEFESAWQQIFSIDNRRGIYFNYFNLAYFAVLTFTVELWVDVETLKFTTAITISGIYIFLVIMSHTVVRILESERAANYRYRKKVNLIRGIFLESDTDRNIQFYLEQKELGIKTFSGKGNEINKVGGTLLPIYFLLKLERISLVALSCMVWLIYFIV